MTESSFLELAQTIFLLLTVSGEMVQHVLANLSLPMLAASLIPALTALARPNDRARCLDAGADDDLRKPVNLREFVSAMQGLVKA